MTWESQEDASETLGWHRFEPDKLDFETAVFLRSFLGQDFRNSTNWSDLRAALKRKGFSLKRGAGTAWLCGWPTGGRICPTRELGFPYRMLAKRLDNTAFAAE